MKGLNLLLVVCVGAIIAEVVSATGSTGCKGICGIGAKCIGGKCKCLRNRPDGNGTFICYSSNIYRLCQIVSDPELTTFDKQMSGLSLPASASLTNLVAQKGKSLCHFKLSAWSQSFGGKYFIKGLQIESQQKYKKIFAQIKVRITAEVVNGKYIYKIKKWHVNTWKPVKTSIRYSRRCKIRFIKTGARFLYIYMNCCRIRFGIRPYDMNNKDVIPGIFILVPKIKTWLGKGLPDYLCNNVTNSPNIDSMKDEYGLKDKHKLVTKIALENGHPTDYYGAYEQLDKLQEQLKACNKDKKSNLKLIKNANFFHTYAKLIDCVESSKGKILGLYSNATKGYCYNDAAACNSARNGIATLCPKLVSKNKEMKAFVHNGCV